MSSSESAPSPPQNPLIFPAAPEVTALLTPSIVLGAITEPTRLLVLKWLMEGGALSVNDLAARAGCASDAMSKHLRVLRNARLINAVRSPNGDGRMSFHQLPPLFCRTDAAGRPVLDFGSVILRL